MRNFLMLLLALFTMTLNAQSGIYDGTYILKLDADNGDFHKWEITLNPDSTFLFHSFSKISMGIPPEKSTYGKGTWRAEKNIIYFTTDKIKDLDETHTLDLSHTKARYESKSPRDKTDRVLPIKLKFYQSDISWVQGKVLLKSE
jgi:hypothetical protein